MKTRPAREISIFNLSMLDVICSALGAFVILFIVGLQNTEQIQTDAEMLAEQNTALQAILSELQQENGRLNAELAEALEALRVSQARVDELERQLAQARQAQQEAASQLQAAQSALSQARSDLDSAQARIRELEQQQSHAQNSLDSAENRIAELERQREEAQRKLEEAQQQISRLQKELNSPFVAILLRWQTPGVDIDLYATNPQGRTCFYRERKVCGGELIHDYQRSGYTEIFLHRKVPPDNAWWTVGYQYFSGSSSAEVHGMIYHSDGLETIPPVTMHPSQTGDPPTTVIKFKVAGNGDLEFASP